jgi:hypothetical protein
MFDERCAHSQENFASISSSSVIADDVCWDRRMFEQVPATAMYGPAGAHGRSAKMKIAYNHVKIQDFGLSN